MGVLYGVRVTFDQLFHLPQVGLLNLLELLLAQTCNKQHGDTGETVLPWKPPKPLFMTCVFFYGVRRLWLTPVAIKSLEDKTRFKIKGKTQKEKNKQTNIISINDSC